MGCSRDLLAEGDGYAIVGCSCGAYYVQVGEASLRLPAERFARLAEAMAAIAAGLGTRKVQWFRRAGEPDGN
jgi:hypothetical protein